MSVDALEQTETLNIPDYACQGFMAVLGQGGILSEWVEVVGYHVDSQTIAVYGEYKFPIKFSGMGVGMIWTCDDIDPTRIDVDPMAWPVQFLAGDKLVVAFGVTS